MITDADKIGKRLRALREYSGLSRQEFGALFRSKENTVYQWEHGYCVPRLVKLLNISAYFDVSLDCILCGRVVSESALEKLLGRAVEPARGVFSPGAGQLLTQFHTLSAQRRERLLGYLDALRRE